MDDKYEKVENEKHCFKKRVDRTADLLKDSYYYKKLSHYCDTETERTRFKNISDILYNIFLDEHAQIDLMLKEQ